MPHMESLYTKLYDKYTELKVKNDSEFKQLNHRQEEKFLNYVSAAEELIEQSRVMNEELQTQMDDMRNQMRLDRSSMDSLYAECQSLLIEEKQKTKMLLEEVERLNNLLFERSHPGITNPSNAQDRSEVRSTPFQGNQVLHAVEEPLEEDLGIGLPPPDSVIKKPARSCGTSMNSLEGTADGRHVDCVFQTLVETLVGMKFSMDNREGLCLSVLHESSGYSFTLTWVKDEVGHEELLYQVLSLGTFERVAPEWMREDLMFSLNMCAMFFQKVTKITRLHC